MLPLASKPTVFYLINTLVSIKLRFCNSSFQYPQHNSGATWDYQQCGMCDQQSLRSACTYAQSDQSLCWSLEYSMNVKLLTKQFLEFLSLMEAAQAGLSLHLSKHHIVGNHMWGLICLEDYFKYHIHTLYFGREIN